MCRSSHEATGFSYLKGNLEFDKLKHGAFRTSITEAELGQIYLQTTLFETSLIKFTFYFVEVRF